MIAAKRVLMLHAVLAVAQSSVAAARHRARRRARPPRPAPPAPRLGRAQDRACKVFVIPKNLGNPYFTTSDSVKPAARWRLCSSSARAARRPAGRRRRRPTRSRHPGGDSQGRQRPGRLGHRPVGSLPDARTRRMKTGITVVTYDSDAPACRDAVRQPGNHRADRRQRSRAARQSEIHDTGQIAILSATASAPNQNAWIGFMKQELKKYPKMKLVTIVYGNDDPTTATQVTQGLLQHYPNLKGIISPTTVGIAGGGAVSSALPRTAARCMFTGLGTPDSMKKYVADGHGEGVRAVEPGQPRLPRRLRRGRISPRGRSPTRPASRFTAGKLGKFTVGADHTILLGPPFVFNKSQYQPVQLLSPARAVVPDEAAGTTAGLPGLRCRRREPWSGFAFSRGSGPTGSMNTGPGTPRSGRR